MRGSSALVSLLSLVLLFLLEVSANPSHPIHLPANETILGQLELAEGEGQCGKQGDGKECPSEECCSYWGWYGTGPAYCASETCQSQCQEPEEPDFSTKSLLMTVKIHHGGIMKRTPDKHYVGGIMDYVNAAELNLVEFKKMMDKMDSVNQSNMGENAKQILYENSSSGNFSDSEANLLDDVTIDTHGKRNQSILEEGELLSVEIKRKIVDIDGDSDCCNSEDTESLHSDSETKSFNSPQQNPKTDGDNPVLGLEYVFDTKMNFKNAVATHEIKNEKSI
ncbi:Chitin-binding lectin 1 [Capsicum chinense]|nr:Chitin-binding lectin 1 [Capsicum chinense]